MKEAEEECSKSVTFLLIGNKADLVSKREVTKEMGSALARKFNISFIETSAKDKMNVREAFSKSSVEIMKKVTTGGIIVDEVGSEGVKTNKHYSDTGDLEKNRQKMH
jgi:GTPase SAR1 family protein